MAARRERPPGRPPPPHATESFHLTKRHASHAALDERERLAEARNKLAGLWTELLLLCLGGAPGPRSR